MVRVEPGSEWRWCLPREQQPTCKPPKRQGALTGEPAWASCAHVQVSCTHVQVSWPRAPPSRLLPTAEKPTRAPQVRLLGAQGLQARRATSTGGRYSAEPGGPGCFSPSPENAVPPSFLLLENEPANTRDRGRQSACEQPQGDSSSLGLGTRRLLVTPRPQLCNDSRGFSQNPRCHLRWTTRRSPALHRIPSPPSIPGPIRTTSVRQT